MNQRHVGLMMVIGFGIGGAAGTMPVWACPATQPVSAAVRSYENLDANERLYVDQTVAFQDLAPKVVDQQIRDVEAEMERINKEIAKLQVGFYRLTGAARAQRLRQVNEQRKELEAAQQKKAALEHEKEKYLRHEKQMTPVWFVPSIGAVGTYPRPVTVFQVIGQREMICKLAGQPAGRDLIYVQGVSTVGRTDGSPVELPPVIVSDTKTYATGGGGTNTVFLAVAVDPARLQPIVDLKLKEKNQPAQASK